MSDYQYFNILSGISLILGNQFYNTSSKGLAFFLYIISFSLILMSLADKYS